MYTQTFRKNLYQKRRAESSPVKVKKNAAAQIVLLSQTKVKLEQPRLR